jgi:hypothetical protein
MKKIKIIYVCLFIPFFVLMALTILKIRHKEEFQQKVILAREMQKALGHLMVDLSLARENSIQDVPTDSLWHDRIAFFQIRQGPMEYLINDGHLLRVNNGKELLISDDIAVLLIRRQKQTPGILEVQIKARKNVSLLSNFRIRMLQ